MTGANDEYVQAEWFTIKEAEIRAKAIECARDVESKCIQTKCSECPMYEECVYLTGIKCPTYPVWSYEQGFADGIKEFAEWLSEKGLINLVGYFCGEPTILELKVNEVLEKYEEEQKNESKRR